MVCRKGLLNTEYIKIFHQLDNVKLLEKDKQMCFLQSQKFI